LTVREAVSDSLRYWEPRRIVFILAVLANVCYCAAYLGDLFVQVSGFRAAWQSWRWVLFAIGVAFAAIITRWFAIAFFTSGANR